MILQLKFLSLLTVILLCSLMIGTGNASALPLNLNSPELQHGTIVSDQFVSQGVHISVDNRGGGPDAALIFNSEESGTEDSDLERGNRWARGNLDDLTEELGNLLIIAENVIDSNNDGLVNRPNDEGSRPAGSIYFDFDYTITSFGFDLIDVEGPDEYSDDSGFFAAFYDGDDLMKSIGFDELITRDDAVFGNNSANRIASFTVEELGLPGFNRVEINMGGSGGITTIAYTPVVPEPTTMLLVGLGLLGIMAVRKRIKK
jgi:hypothetical protein